MVQLRKFEKFFIVMETNWSIDLRKTLRCLQVKRAPHGFLAQNSELFLKDLPTLAAQLLS
jgi:hypothetical protein